MSELFSIVIQGGVLNSQGDLDLSIIKNIEKVRREFDNSEIVLSTWIMNDTITGDLNRLAEKLSLNVIYNKDPGSISSNDKTISSNINRMLVSSRNGILSTTRDFVIKIRTDSYLINKNLSRIFLKVLNGKLNDKRIDTFKVFESYVINCSLFARDARGYLPYLFHPGDICLAGRKGDVLALFDIPLAEPVIFSNISRLCFLSFMRLVPEQYMWVHCIKSKTKKDIYAGNHIYNSDTVNLSENYYVNNFISLSAEQIGFEWPKYKIVYNRKGRYSIYSLNDWKVLFNKHIKRYYITDNKALFHKKIITYVMRFYFFIRTQLLKVSCLRNIAIRLFRNRG